MVSLPKGEIPGAVEVDDFHFPCDVFLGEGEVGLDVFEEMAEHPRIVAAVRGARGWALDADEADGEVLLVDVEFDLLEGALEEEGGDGVDDRAEAGHGQAGGEGD